MRIHGITKMTAEYFDKDYFTDGIKSHKSGYDADSFVLRNDIFKNQALMLIDILNLENKIVLDIGCARNNLAYWFSELGIDAYGIDISQWCFANSHLPQKHFLGDIEDGIPKGDKFFDYVVSFEVFEHFQNPDTAITEIKRVLKDNGVLFATIGAGDHKHDVSAVSAYNKNWWTSTLCRRFTNVLPDLESRFLEHSLVKTYNWTPYCYQK